MTSDDRDEIDQVVVAQDGSRVRIEPAPTGPAAPEPIVAPRVDAEPAHGIHTAA